MLQRTQRCICLFELVLYSLDKYTEAEKLCPMVVLFLIFWRLSILLFIVAAPTVYKGSLFSTPSPTFIIFCLFDNNHSNRYKVVSVVLICISPTSDVDIFLCICWPSVCLLWKKCLFRSSAWFLSGFFFFKLITVSSYTSWPINPSSEIPCTNVSSIP